MSPNTESPFVRLRVISWIESLLTATDPLNHTKGHEKAKSVSCVLSVLAATIEFAVAES